MADVTGSFITSSIFSGSNFFANTFLSGSQTAFSSSTGNTTTFLNAGGPSGKVTTYIKRGWYTIGQQFEYWQTTDPKGSPPSGHTLLDITITETYSI
jgi:hypothetical protein